MKKTLLTAMVGLLVLSAVASAQTITFTRGVKKLYIPYKSPPPPMVQYVPTGLVVKLKAPVTTTSLDTRTRSILTGQTSLDELNKKYQVESFVREFPECKQGAVDVVCPDLARYYVLKFGEKYRLDEVLKAYASNEYVETSEPIGIHPVYEQIPNDPYFLSDQWNFYDAEDNDVDATDAWDHETGDANVILGLLETGLQYTSVDLGGMAPYTQGNVWINWAEYNGAPGVDDDGNGYLDDWVGWDFVHGVSPLWPGEDGTTPDNEPTDFNGHGTHVAGIMGAITNNATMVAGLAGGWNTAPGDPANGVKIMALRIGWSAPYLGQEVGYVRMDFAAQAIYYAVNKGATALNCSWGSSNSGGLGAAVDYATANGVLVVAAAGNDGDAVADYLGNRADVINVCATNDDDVKAPFSDYGTWVDVAAPGVDILSTYSFHYNPNYVAWVSGTSQAAPHVTGLAGLLKSYADTLTRDQIDMLIRTYTDDIDHLNPAYAGLMGSGRINAFKAIDGVEAPEVTVIQPNGGEVLFIGQVYEVIWEASDNVGIVSTTIDYSHDGGGSWVHVADLVGNPETYDWTVTGPPSDQCRMRVTCYDAVGQGSSDMSDEDFCPPYKVSAAKTFAIAADGVVPVEFALRQNYPNPFNPATRISFSLPAACDVRVEVYNITGRKVATIANGWFEAGHHSLRWNGGKLASGVYLYRLHAGDQVDVKRMVLLK